MKQNIKIFTDGGSRGNPGKAASGAVIEGIAGKERLICGKYLGETTNNVAEYSAVELAYETLLKDSSVEPKETSLKLFTDSLLVAKQLSGEYRVKNPSLAEIIKKIRVFETKFALVSYQHIPREENYLADREVNRVLDEN